MIVPNQEARSRMYSLCHGEKYRGHVKTAASETMAMTKPPNTSSSYRISWILLVVSSRSIGPLGRN
ncbi:hypothetical protein J6590_044603 [Homalodisca vitripennis]|nr:hypothetical protein J6590_044603 [Homalodisca vitripennis]